MVTCLPCSSSSQTCLYCLIGVRSVSCCPAFSGPFGSSELEGSSRQGVGHPRPTAADQWRGDCQGERHHIISVTGGGERLKEDLPSVVNFSNVLVLLVYLIKLYLHTLLSQIKFII